MNMINNRSVHPLNHYIGQVLPSLGNENTSPPTRTRITRACDHCQLRKTKCDSMKPRCSQCIKRNDPCTFNTRVCKRGPKPKRHSYLYSTTREAQVIKSTNVFPYPNYMSTSNNQQYREYDDNNKGNVNIKNDTEFHRFRYYSQHLEYPQQYNNNGNRMEYSSSSISNCSLPLQNFEFQKLPPIQLSKPSSPQKQSFEQYSGESLRLPSLSRATHNRLPSISALLRGESDDKVKNYSKPTSEISPNIYKIAQRNYYKPMNSTKYYSNNNQSRNTYLRELY